MIINYINSAIKQFWKNRFFTTVNLVSLSVAFFIAYVVMVYIMFQFSYDKNHEKREQLFLVQSYLTDFRKTRMKTAYRVGESLQQKYPEVITSTRYHHYWKSKIIHQNEEIQEREFYAIDDNVFDVFTIPFLNDINPKGLLIDKNNILISEKAAEKFFGDINPIGENLKVKHKGKEQVFTVRAVFYNLPENSSFRPDFLTNINFSLETITLLSDENIHTGIIDNWGGRDYYTYLLLNKDCDHLEFQKKLNGFIAERSDSIKNTELRLVPFQTMYQDLFLEYEVVFILLILGLLVLFVASANYIVLSSAISIKRSKEIGMRKVMGAKPLDIRKQFLGESILLSVLAIVPSVFLYKIFLPHIMPILDIPIEFFNNRIFYYLPYFVLLSIFIGFLSGYYVSYRLSHIEVVKVLKSGFLKLSSKSFFRKTLIVFQLFIVIILISTVFGVRLQMNFGQNIDMGFDRENIILVNFEDINLGPEYLANIKKNPSVISAAAAMEGPPSNSSMSYMVSRFDKPEEEIRLEGMAIDFDFLELFDFELIEGRFFSREYPGDYETTILNETAVYQLGFKEPIGKIVAHKEVIGVIKDFHFHSIHYPIPPLNIDLTKNYLNQIAVKYKSGTEELVREFLQKEWGKLDSAGRFYLLSFDETLEELYSKEKTYANIIAFIAFIICLIALSGLFGLSLFLIRTKQREVGLRKLFGASIANIQNALFKEFSRHVLIAFLFATPVSYLIISEYLKIYAYKTPLNIWIFLIPGLITFLVVLLSVAFYLVKAAKTNIVDTLKEE